MPRLLVIDDDAAVRALAPRIAFQHVGTAVDIRIASDVGEALALLAAHPAEVALVDFFMPSLDGPELVRRLQGAHPGLRAMFMTGDMELVGRDLPGALAPVRDKADLEAVLIEALEACLAVM